MGTGATLFGSSLAGKTVSAREQEPDFKRVIQDSLKYRSAVDDREAWFDYLQHRGIAGARVSQTYDMPIERRDDSDFSTQEYLKSELNISLSIVYNCSKESYYAELSWRYDDSANMAKGSDPIDTVAMAYERDWWDLRYYSLSGTTETSQYVTLNESDGFDGKGPAYYMDDLQAWRDGRAGNLHYAGIYLTPEGSDSNLRRVYGAYVHNFSGLSGGYDVSIGLNYGVVSVSGSSIGDDSTWKTRTEDDGDTPLLVNEDQADPDCGGVT